MASGTVTYSALMTPHQEVYNGKSAKTWRVSQSGSFPSDDYVIVSAVIHYDIRNVYAADRHMQVSRVDGGAGVLLGDVPTGTTGAQTGTLTTAANYEGIKTIMLDGVERWACQLRGGSSVVIEVVWEDKKPQDVEPEKPAPVPPVPKVTGDQFEAAVSVLFDGVNISEQVNQYLLSLTYTDNEEDVADDLQIKLQDADGQWLRKWLDDAIQAAAVNKASSGSASSSDGARTTTRMTLGEAVRRATSGASSSGAAAPKKTKGLNITAGIGTANRGSLNCGSFELDSVTADGPPSTITIKGTSLPYANGVRTEERDKAWEGYSLSKIGKEIAGKAGLGFIYDCSSDPSYRRIEQTKQTDISFLQDLCHNAGYSLKVADQRMVIFDQAKYEEASPGLIIGWQDGTYTKYRLATGSCDVQYAKCTVSYYHPEQKRTITATVEADDFDPESENNQLLKITNHRVESEAEAKDLAHQMLRLHNKYEKSAQFTIVGNPMLGAGLTVRIVGFGMWDGKYMIKQARHEVGSSGYTTKLTLRWVFNQNGDESTEKLEAVKKETKKKTESSGGGSGKRYY